MSVVASSSLRINITKLVKILSDIPDKRNKSAWVVWLGTLGEVIDSLQSNYDFLSGQYGKKEKS